MKNKVTLALIIVLIGILVFTPQAEEYRPWWWRRVMSKAKAKARANDVRTISGGVKYVSGCPSVAQYNKNTSYPGTHHDNFVRYCNSTLSSRTDACKKEACNDSYFKGACRNECASV